MKNKKKRADSIADYPKRATAIKFLREAPTPCFQNHLTFWPYVGIGENPSDDLDEILVQKKILLNG